MTPYYKHTAAFRTALFTLAIGGLAACSSTPRPQAGRPATVQSINNEQQIADVVAALESGDVGRARKLLKEMSRRNPADRQVQVLVQSLDGDPAAALGSQSFAYTVQHGDRMTVLAQRYLGDRLKVYLLMRYNGLKTAMLAPGQVIRVPGIAPPPPPPPAVRQRAEPRPAAPPAPRPAQPAPLKNAPLAASLRGQAIKALDQGKVATAVVLLRRAKSLDPSNTAVQRDLLRAERLLATVRARK